MSTQWADVIFARKLWQDAPSDDEVLSSWLVAATTACQAYAPVLEDETAPPDGYRIATVLHARDAYSSLRVAGDVDEIGDPAYGVRVRPLSGTVRQLLRPRLGRPRFGRRPSTTVNDQVTP